jgi:hypothetical protein
MVLPQHANLERYPSSREEIVPVLLVPLPVITRSQVDDRERIFLPHVNFPDTEPVTAGDNVEVTRAYGREFDELHQTDGFQILLSFHVREPGQEMLHR